MSRIHKKKINNIVSIYHTIKTNQFPGKSINSLKIATLPEGGGFRFIDNPTINILLFSDIKKSGSMEQVLGNKITLH